MLCEYSAAIVDSFLSGHNSGNDIIIVSYKGKSETRKDVASDRAKYITDYFTTYRKGTKLSRSPIQVVGSVGLEEKNEAEVRIYVDGKPRIILYFRDNRLPRLQPCYEEPKPKRGTKMVCPAEEDGVAPDVIMTVSR